MKRLALIALLLAAGLSVQTPARAQTEPDTPKGMSALEILDAINSPDAAMRDRGESELKLMDAKVAEALGKQVLRSGVREGEAVLTALSKADCANSALAAFVSLDSKEKTIRIAALDTITALSPASVSEGGAKHLTARRLEIVRKLVSVSDYVKEICESVTEQDQGALRAPVLKLLRLTIMLDRFFGVKGMPMLLSRIAGYMLGDQPGDKPKSDTQRNQEERLRHDAVVCLEAVWVKDPAIQFNYSPTAPYEDRQKAVSRINALLDKLQQTEVEFDGGSVKFTGQRYGDHLRELYSGSDVNEVRAAAYLRFQWWMGEDVPVAGKGYAEAVDKVNALNRRARSQLRRKIAKWWQEYRTATEIK